MEKGLIGMRVRDARGGEGLIAEQSDEQLDINWTDTSVLDPVRERVPLTSPKFARLEVLTLTEGWKPMSEQVGTTRTLTLVEDLEQLLADPAPAEVVAESVESLEEAKANKKAKMKAKLSGKAAEKQAREKQRSRARGGEGGKGKGHNPFKTKTHLGPGPRSGENSQTHNWKCSCPTPYKCLCKSGKKRKVIRIKRAYKQDYNAEYKAWRRQQKF